MSRTKSKILCATLLRLAIKIVIIARIVISTLAPAVYHPQNERKTNQNDKKLFNLTHSSKNLFCSANSTFQRKSLIRPGWCVFRRKFESISQPLWREKNTSNRPIWPSRIKLINIEVSLLFKNDFARCFLIGKPTHNDPLILDNAAVFNLEEVVFAVECQIMNVTLIVGISLEEGIKNLSIHCLINRRSSYDF